ncbi:MAG: PAS domain-containing protein [Lachnospiraceae bacterium]|nr:PAS domain-containing protein [Lachnospiraceae bacterium]
MAEDNMNRGLGRAEREEARNEAERLRNTAGHPVAVLSQENEAIRRLTDGVRRAADQDRAAALQALGALREHYDKKRDLIYPMLDADYHIPGPSRTMWPEDDRIRRELKKAAKAAGEGTGEGAAMADGEGVQSLLEAVDAMIRREEEVLLPLCVQFFSEEDWLAIRRDLDRYDNSLTGPLTSYRPADKDGCEEAAGCFAAAAADDEVVLPSGHMSRRHMEAMLQTIPVELTFVDETDTNRYFSKGNTGFRRSLSALDRNVYTCHVPASLPAVRRIIESFRSGEKDCVEVWLEKKGEPLYVRYIAVRDEDGSYLGTLECVQNMRFARDHFLKDVDKSTSHR